MYDVSKHTLLISDFPNQGATSVLRDL